MNDMLTSQLTAMREQAGYVTLPPRTHIEVSGEDRRSWLHNLTSNDIKSLPAGQGCEAFVLNAAGKILGYLFVYAGDSTISLDTIGCQGEKLLEHFEKYLIIEDVQLIDRTNEFREVAVIGPAAADAVEKLLGKLPPEGAMAHCHAELDDVLCHIRRAPLAKDCLIVRVANTRLEELQAALAQTDLVECDAEAFEVMRLSAAAPIYGRDITEKNLPQEVRRDQQAINFVTGCYIGQETVARIDALGHVNWHLVPWRFAGQDPPPDGFEIKQDGKVVARITSAAHDPQQDNVVALGYVRRELDQEGTELNTDHGAACIER